LSWLTRRAAVAAAAAVTSPAIIDTEIAMGATLLERNISWTLPTSAATDATVPVTTIEIIVQETDRRRIG
jgi:hypothetical protein